MVPKLLPFGHAKIHIMPCFSKLFSRFLQKNIHFIVQSIVLQSIDATFTIIPYISILYYPRIGKDNTTLAPIHKLHEMLTSFRPIVSTKDQILGQTESKEEHLR